jgi:hypothetical protein
MRLMDKTGGALHGPTHLEETYEVCQVGWVGIDAKIDVQAFKAIP